MKGTASRRTKAATGVRPSARWGRGDLLAFAVPFGVYLATAAPTVYNLDSAELSTAAYTGGILRATGYPLYLLLGRVWSQVPLGDVGWRMNLLSAVCGALTIFLAHRLLRRFGVGPWASVGALGLLAASRYFWAMSLIAEVYTLHTALIAGVILLLVRWGESPTPGRLALATFAVGLASGNHVATVLLAPGCLWYVLATDARAALQWRSLGGAAVGLLAGLSIYLYLPLLYLTQPAFNYAGHYDGAGRFVPVDLTTLSGLWWVVSGRVFAGQMLAYSGWGLVAEYGHFLAELWRAFLVVGVGPGVVGAVVLARRKPATGLALALMFVVTVGFYVDYRVVDKDTMFLGAYLVFALWVGVGYQWLEELLGPSGRGAAGGSRCGSRWWRGRWRRWPGTGPGSIYRGTAPAASRGRRCSPRWRRTGSSSASGTRCRWWSTCRWWRGAGRTSEPSTASSSRTRTCTSCCGGSRGDDRCTCAPPRVRACPG